MLDTTDEYTLTTAAARMTPDRTWFVVASKSGGTVEVASMERFFWSVVTRAVGERAGRQFIAITDPGTALEQLAATRGYRETFINPADIGGRFSALSLFGLVPTALIGAPVRDLHAAGKVMADGCRQENHANAGFELGSFIGAATVAGRDKLTVILPPSLSTLGLWIEQLIAESTGKHGKGALPVVDEPLGGPDEYGQDRAFVAVATDRDAPDKRLLASLESAGHPVLHLTTRLDGLGAEFFRWEFATAVAGAALNINPFDEPNVAEAKSSTGACWRPMTRPIDCRKPSRSPAGAVSPCTPARLRDPHQPTSCVRPSQTSSPATTSPSFPICPRAAKSKTPLPGSAARSGEDPGRLDVRRGTALPPLDRSVPQRRAQHGAGVSSSPATIRRRRRSRGRATPSRCSSAHRRSATTRR